MPVCLCCLQYGPARPQRHNAGRLPLVLVCLCWSAALPAVCRQQLPCQASGSHVPPDRTTQEHIAWAMQMITNLVASGSLAVRLQACPLKRRTHGSRSTSGQDFCTAVQSVCEPCKLDSTVTGLLAQACCGCQQQRPACPTQASHLMCLTARRTKACSRNSSRQRHEQGVSAPSARSFASEQQFLWVPVSGLGSGAPCPPQCTCRGEGSHPRPPIPPTTTPPPAHLLDTEEWAAAIEVCRHRAATCTGLDLAAACLHGFCLYVCATWRWWWQRSFCFCLNDGHHDPSSSHKHPPGKTSLLPSLPPSLGHTPCSSGITPSLGRGWAGHNWPGNCSSTV